MKPIRIGSEDVFPDEVEGVLRYHPAVADAAVVGVPDRATNRLVALVQARPGSQAPDSEEIRTFCIGRLTGFKVPRTVLAVARLERLENGRVDYEWAARRAQELLATSTPS